MSAPDAGAASPPGPRRIALAWSPALAYMALIWWLSSIPIELPLPSIPWRDKLAHMIEYGILGVLVAHAVSGTWPRLGRGRAWLAAFGITFAWGYLDEIHQVYVPGRDANALDLLADAVGAALGATLYAAGRALLLARRLRKRHPQ